MKHWPGEYRSPGRSSQVADWLHRRRELGQDRYDEVWQGTPYIAPLTSAEHGVAALQIMIALEDNARTAGLYSVGSFRIGTDDSDFRMPDGGWLRKMSTTSYPFTAAAVLEVLTPDDATMSKMPFYAQHEVAEVLVAHPTERWVHCYQRVSHHHYRVTAGSLVLGIGMSELAAKVRWP